jgi:hypothetical protein
LIAACTISEQVTVKISPVKKQDGYKKSQYDNKGYNQVFLFGVIPFLNQPGPEIPPYGG